MRILDEAGQALPPGEVGELWVHSPGRALGYHNLPEVTAQRFTSDGWLRTGDLMRAEEIPPGVLPTRQPRKNQAALDL